MRGRQDTCLAALVRELDLSAGGPEPHMGRALERCTYYPVMCRRETRLLQGKTPPIETDNGTKVQRLGREHHCANRLSEIVGVPPWT